MTVTPAGHCLSITGTGAGSVTGLPPSAPEAHSHFRGSSSCAPGAQDPASPA